MTYQMRSCKQWLAVVWFSLSALIAAVVVVQCILGKYDDKVNEAVGWLLPTVMPTLSLMIAVFAAGAITGSGENQSVDAFMFWLTFTVSLFYLTFVAATVFLAPFATVGPLALMKLSNLWLGPCQGLAAAALGVFFVNPK